MEVADHGKNQSSDSLFDSLVMSAIEAKRSTNPGFEQICLPRGTPLSAAALIDDLSDQSAKNRPFIIRRPRHEMIDQDKKNRHHDCGRFRYLHLRG